MLLRSICSIFFMITFRSSVFNRVFRFTAQPSPAQRSNSQYMIQLLPVPHPSRPMLPHLGLYRYRSSTRFSPCSQVENNNLPYKGFDIVNEFDAFHLLLLPSFSSFFVGSFFQVGGGRFGEDEDEASGQGSTNV